MKQLTVQNYYDQDEYMSVSSFKLYKECEKKGLVGFGKPTEAMLVGSYVDSYIEGTLEEFKLNNPEIISSRGESKGQLKSEFRYADEICKFIDNDKVFSQFMSGEKQRIMTGEIGGVPFKIKMDSYSPNIAINDLKVMATITTRNTKLYYDFITPYGYDLQLGAYQEIVYQNTGVKLPVYICAVTKESPINSIIINIPQQILDSRLYEIETNIKRFYDVKMKRVEPNGCGICSICIAERKETPIISLLDIV
jgi:hypothetical protein